MAVIECDELYIKQICNTLQPKIIVITNLAADQIDRLHGSENVREILQKTVDDLSDTICVTNRKLAACMRSEKDTGRIRSFDVVNGRITVEDDEYSVRLSIPGDYNHLNAAAACTVMKSLGLLSVKTIDALAGTSAPYGRMETFSLDGIDVTINLTKNPTGVNLTLDFIDNEFDRLYKNDAYTIGLGIGDSLTRRQLLELVIISSACDAATVLADDLSDGNLNAFIVQMNNLAKECGMEDTSFSSVHGVYENTIPKPLSTVHDVAIMTELALKTPVLNDIIMSDRCVNPVTNDVYFSANIMMQPNRHEYRQYIKGGKTGRTDLAGFCLSVIAEYNGYSIIAVILGSPYVVGQSECPLIYSELSYAFDSLFGLC